MSLSSVPPLTLGPSGIAAEEGAELSVVIPTFKERGNIRPLLAKLDAALGSIRWEAIFVDDNSPDGTTDEVKAAAMQDRRVRCIRRIGRRGLAGACIEGMSASAAPYVAVMDADLQHDETALPRMLEALKAGNDLVVATRYVEGGSAGSFSKARGFISRSATWLAQVMTRVPLNDPMSGFFMMRRTSFDVLAPKLTTQGFKILLDIAITARGNLKIAEVPFSFGTRLHGESKLDAQVGMDFLGLLLAKLTGGLITPRFLSFMLVGLSGLVVHLIVLKTALSAFSLPFPESQAIATFVAMTGNFFFNNVLTYRDRRLSGFPMVKGLIGFYAVSAVGALTNVGMASWLYAHQPVWWLAGAAGAVMGAVWNYSMSTLLVWRVK